MRTCDFPFGFGIPSPSLTLPRHKPVLHFAGIEAEHVHGWSDAFVPLAPARHPIFPT